MALFTRRKQDGAESAESDAERLQGGERRTKTIGELLSEARERHGVRIEDIGAALRIRSAFLKAIEEDQYASLPGPVYALGFVRTYADYLGLDGEMFARRFKSEIAGLEKRRDFTLPMPLPERGVPGGAILLVALIVAACAYAVWLYRGSGERARPERVAAVPEQLMPLPPAPPPPSATAAPNEPASANPPAASPPTVNPATAAPDGTPTAAPGDAAAATRNPAPAPATTAPSVPPAAAAPAPALPAAPGATAPLQTAAPQLASASTTAPLPANPSPTIPPPAPSASTASPASPDTIAVTSTAATPAIPDVPAAAPSPSEPRVFGITNGPVRVVIKSTGDSWVQVRDASQTPIQTRTLHAGDSLRVPDLPDLTIRAGNAGALQISVDGKPVPPLGPAGKARSASLDPNRLIAGTATQE